MVNLRYFVGKEVGGLLINWARVRWVYSFGFQGDRMKVARDKWTIWKDITTSAYFLGNNLESLVGEGKQIDLEPIKLEPRKDVLEQLSKYQKTGVLTDVRAEFFEQTRGLALSVSIVLFPKWHTGIAIISTETSVQLRVDEVLLVGRILGHRRQKLRDVFFESAGKRVDQALLDSLKCAERLTGIKIFADKREEQEILKSVYFFIELVNDNLAEREKLGLLNHSISYRTDPEDDIRKLGSTRIPMGKDQKLYLQQYDGGFISNRKASEGRYRDIFNTLVILMALRAFNTHVMSEAITAATGPASIGKVERLLTDISSLSLLLSPNVISSGYRFNSFIIPIFLVATGLDKARDNLENMLRTFEDIQDRKENRMRNVLVVLLSTLALIIAFLPYLVSFFQSLHHAP